MDGVFDISKFDEYREDNRLEVKRAKDKLPDSLWETYSSFANTEGGCIILGVKEREDKSWYTTGLKDISKLRKEFTDIIHNQNKVNVPLISDNDIIDYEVNGDVILVIKVPKARREEKPVYINNDMWNGTYRRDGEGDYRCSREVILAMLRDQTEESPDMKVLENKEVKDLNQDSIKSYRMRYNASHEGHLWTSLPDDEFLVQIGAASDETTDNRIHPTVAGLLMFGNYHRIMREFPSFLLDYYELTDPALRWTDRLSSHSGDWSGNVYDFYNKVYQRIAVDLKKPFKLDGIYRIDDTPVHVAVREAMANCLSNADYFSPECVKIKKYPDRIVLENPGTILLGKKQMLRGGKSRPRNKIILNMLNYIGVGERAGSGVPNIYSIWEQEGYVEPTVDELSGREGTIITVVTLPFVKKDQSRNQFFSEKGTEKGTDQGTKKNEEISKRLEAVFDLIRQEPTISQKSIAEKLGISLKQAKNATELLKQKHRIHREGSARSGKWIID
jgi:ATP-dependent DNA helicase RecG